MTTAMSSADAGCSTAGALQWDKRGMKKVSELALGAAGRGNLHAAVLPAV